MSMLLDHNPLDAPPPGLAHRRCSTLCDSSRLVLHPLCRLRRIAGARTEALTVVSRTTMVAIFASSFFVHLSSNRYLSPLSELRVQTAIPGSNTLPLQALLGRLRLRIQHLPGLHHREAAACVFAPALSRRLPKTYNDAFPRSVRGRYRRMASTATSHPHTARNCEHSATSTASRE